MGLNLSTNLPMFVYTFQAMWRHRPLKQYWVFVGIRVACTSFSQYTLLPTTQFTYQKDPGTCDWLLCVSHALQSALESGQKDRSVQIDFSAAFDKVNNQDILYRLCSVGIGGSVLPMLTQFLSNRSQHVMVDGWWSIWVPLCQECQRAVFWAC